MTKVRAQFREPANLQGFKVHRISSIKIENFKSVIEGEFPLTPYTVLVGYNNAGKTNILHALSWVIKKNSLPAKDFFNPQNPIIVTAEISGITADVLDALGDNHRTKIEPSVVDGQISIRRTQLQPDARAADIRIEITAIDDDGKSTWKLNPAGIDAAISALFPEPISIGAMENATEDVGKFAAGTTIGKLIKEIIAPVTEAYAGPVTEALADIAMKLTAESADKDASLVTLDAQIEAELGKIFPGVSAKTHIPTPEFGDFLKGATIKIFEENFHNPDGRDVASFGHGAQRSVQIALIKCLSQIKRAGAAGVERTTLLLIDEPELYLHPQAIELVRSSLNSLSGEGYQVVFSTHSPSMIARQDAHNALLIRRSVAEGTKAYPRLRDAVLDAVADAAHQAETLFTLTNASKILFSENVVLAEGKTERALLPDMFVQEVGSTMDEGKLGLVTLGGSGNIPNAMKVLAAMGIPSKAIVDLDFAFRLAPSAGLIPADHPAITACKAVFLRLSNAGRLTIDGSGLPTNANGVTAPEAFEIMCGEPDATEHVDAIQVHLSALGIWCWTKGAIETHLGLANKKPATHMNFLSNIGNGNFRAGLPDYESVQAMMHWLRQV